MKKFTLITTKYCDGCPRESKAELKTRFNYDGELDDIHVNFSDKFDPWNQKIIPQEIRTKAARADLIYGKIFLLRQYIKDHILSNYEFLLHIDYLDTINAISM